jgi:hypothetical protein
MLHVARRTTHAAHSLKRAAHGKEEAATGTRQGGRSPRILPPRFLSRPERTAVAVGIVADEALDCQRRTCHDTPEPALLSLLAHTAV